MNYMEENLHRIDLFVNPMGVAPLFFKGIGGRGESELKAFRLTIGGFKTTLQTKLRAGAVSMAT